MEEKPIVAHVNATFFEGSETFIYHYLTHFESWRPLCLARGLKNLDRFPFPGEDIYLIAYRRYSPRWLFYTTARKATGRDLVLTRTLEGKGARLIHAHFGLNGYLALSTVEKLSIPLVTTFYGFDVSIRKYLKQVKSKYEILFEQGQLFLVEGPYMQAKLRELGCPDDKTAIQRIAIPVQDISFKPRKPKRKGEKIVLICTGRFIEKKGIFDALRASREVWHTHKDFELRIIGDGPLKGKLQKYISDYAMEEYVKLPGFLDYRGYLKELSAADICLQPSVTSSDGDTEGGAPTVLLEAQASGVPVITTRHADIPNVVLPGSSALLCKEGDWQALAENMLRLFDTQDEWAGMGKCGRAFVEERHDIEKEARNLEARYAELLIDG